MDFELRPLQADDMFTMLQLLTKIGLEDIKNIINPKKMAEMSKMVNDKTENGKSLDVETMLGMSVITDVIPLIIKKLPACKNEIYTLLSNLSGIPKKEFFTMPLLDFTEMVVAVIKKEEFKDFFKVVSKSFK